MPAKIHKLPAFQFYPGDWRKDPGVQALSFHDRGVWFEILCLMHESEDRGRLVLNGNAMSEVALARLLGLPVKALVKSVETLLAYGVASRDDSGVLFCRRMVRDERLRRIRSESGKLGGNPNLLNQTASKSSDFIENRHNQVVTPSISTSHSSSRSKKKELSTESSKKKAVSQPKAVATRLPDPFPLTREMWAWISEQKLEIEDVPAAHAEWVEYWTNNTTAKAVKPRWDLAWQKGMRLAAQWEAERGKDGTSKPQTFRQLRNEEARSEREFFEKLERSNLARARGLPDADDAGHQRQLLTGNAEPDA